MYGVRGPTAVGTRVLVGMSGSYGELPPDPILQLSGMSHSFRIVEPVPRSEFVYLKMSLKSKGQTLNQTFCFSLNM